jgi:hypothetical protein
VYARLNVAYGWSWQYDDGTVGPFILQNVERYAGMVTGWTPDGRKCARPMSEVEALSTDGETWHPTSALLVHVPQEENSGRVRNIRDVPLPVAFDEDQ